MITHNLGGDGKKRGSLKDVITDITKASVCPPVESPINRYSIIRYFSRIQNSDYPSISGVIGDGGHKFVEGDLGGDPMVGGYNYVYGSYHSANLALNTKVPFTTAMIDNEAVAGENNYLNICNQKEFVEREEYDDSVCNIQKENEVVAKDMDGYYNYYLYKPNHTQNIIIAGTETPVSKTAELMEFVYLHAKIPRCKSGELYIEIEDFDIVGSISPDCFVYVYYWESNTDNRTMAGALLDTVYDETYPQMLSTNNGNVLKKILNISDLQGTVTDKKLVIFLDKQKSRGESLCINVAIGLKPNDLRKDMFTVTGYYGDINYIATDEPAQLIFKFKKATIKINQAYNGLIRGSPDMWPTSAYKDLDGDADAYPGTVHNHHINIPIMPLNSLGEAISVMIEGNVTNFGIPNGGAGLFGVDYWIHGYAFYNFSAYSFGKSINHADLNGVTYNYGLMSFFKSLKLFNADETYRIKLPPMTYTTRFRGNQPAGYELTNQLTPSDYVYRVYAGEALTTREGQDFAEYKTMIESFVLLKEFTVAELTTAYVPYNSGDDLDTTGTPFNLAEEIFLKRNMPKYVEFSGGDIDHIPNPVFYLSLEREGTSILTVSYSKQVEDTFAYPVGWTPLTRSYSQRAIGIGLSEYTILNSDGEITEDPDYLNYDTMIYQPPQIIDKTARPKAEKYFT